MVKIDRNGFYLEVERDEEELSVSITIPIPTAAHAAAEITPYNPTDEEARQAHEARSWAAAYAMVMTAAFEALGKQGEELMGIHANNLQLLSGQPPP